MRLQITLYGYPFAQIRADPPGSRPEQADSYGLAYRRSVYTKGKYIGVIDKMGSFTPVDQDSGDGQLDRRSAKAFLGTVWFYRNAPWLGSGLGVFAGLPFVYDVLRKWRTRRWRRTAASPPVSE